MSTDVYTHDNKNMTIDRIEFGVLGNKEVEEMSVIKEPHGISKSESYNNFEPVIGGLVDKRMGITDSHLECATCGHNSIKCPGHFGHIELAEPVYHVGYIPYIKKILSCICIKCSKLLVYKNEAEIEDMLKNKSGKARFAEIRNLCKSVSYCQKTNYGCGAPVSKIKVDIKKSTSAINIIAETNLSTLSTDEQTGQITDGKKKIRQIITPEMCYSILKNISDIDCEIMGLNPKKTRPEMMILKVFPVPPIQVRPSAKADFLASATFEDDLTHKLADIINSNIRIRKYKEKEGTDGKHSVFGTDTLYLLQYHVATFFDNDSVSLLKSEQRNGKPIKSVSARLKTKEGRVRGNLMGKRVDFSSRTVIGPDPNLDINELGVPLKIAMNLTFPEVVTLYNIDKLTELVRNGRDTYPGANFVFPISSFTSDKRYIIDLRYRKENVVLRFGDVVERHIVNGDVVLFNRQPSLHKLSMMAHRIRVIPNMNLSTFKLNLAVTPPYNADFDGDEMNMFVPQSIQAQVELDLIANVKRQIISPGTSAPVIGCVQDTVLGSYLFTSNRNEISWRDVMNLMMYTSLETTKVDKKKNYSGQEIFSKIIPRKINMSMMTDAGKVVIRNGEIQEGIMSKKTIGSKKNSIIHLVWNEYGMEETQKFIDNTQRLINNWLLYNGFTISLGDTFVPEQLTEQIQSMVETKKLEVNHLITEMENNPEIMDSDIFERSIAADLNAIGGTVNELIYNNLNEDNNFFVTVTSGSKGSKINIGAIAGIVGQQNVESKRIRKRVNNRTLYHFHQNDDSALARGFCQNSYLDALSPQEFYFHTMAGREGLIDTAIKSVTGDTPIIISENNGVNVKRVLIGDWIDSILDDKTNKQNIQHIEERDMELLELDQKKFGKLYIPTADENGTTSWGLIKNITRHDPGKELYKITTLGGRQVIVTESKSLLIWDETESKFLRKSTPDIVEGDFVPVTMKLERKENDSKELKNIFNKFWKENETVLKIKCENQENMDHVNMILNQYGIFGKNKDGHVIVEGKWYIKLVNKFNMNLDCNISSDDKVFREHNDVVLDPIMSIEKVGIEKYPKVYDLTIPSTLNFGLANGLHVVDTADTGYIQRKLIKALEDILVKYDGTVRNSNNTIIQFLYGDNNVNPANQVEHKLNIVNMNNKEINETYKFTPEQLKSINKSGKGNFTDKDNNKLYKSMIDIRDDLRYIQRKATLNYITVNDKYMLPVDLNRIINNIKYAKLEDDNNETLEPQYVLDRLEKLLSSKDTRIVCMSKKQRANENSLKYMDEMDCKTMFRFSLFEYLSPKRCIYEYKLNKMKFDTIIKNIINDFQDARVQAGEMVGVVAAQSIGEPATQIVKSCREVTGSAISCLKTAYQHNLIYVG